MNESSGQVAADLCVAMTAHDSMRTIERSLSSVLPIARRTVVVDSGSTDGTIELCKRYGAEVIHKDWEGHTRQKQFALDQCAKHKWILVLDSDESVEQSLADSIQTVVKTDDQEIDGWCLNRKIWFLGGWLNHTFQPEWRLRLVRGGVAKVIGNESHDQIVVSGRTKRLAGDLRHDSWEDLSDMMHRHLSFAQLAARNGHRGGSAISILCNPPMAFLKQYVLKRGILDGRRGFLAASGMAAGTLVKHLFIAQKKWRGLAGAETRLENRSD